MKYEIQHRIETLARIAMVDDNPFSSLEIYFANWEFWHEKNFWLAKGTVEASNLNDAMASFNEKLLKLIPPIGLISQCYTEFRAQPFLVK